MDKQRYVYTVKDNDKMFDLLDILARATGHMTVPVLAKRLKVPKTRVLRLLDILQARQLVMHDDVTGECQLGYGAYVLSQSILNSNSLLKLAHPVMEDLARKLDEAIYITVMSDDEVLFLDMVDSLQRIKTAPMCELSISLFYQRSRQGNYGHECNGDCGKKGTEVVEQKRDQGSGQAAFRTAGNPSARCRY
jgi:predicted transcriptional regulator